MSQIGETKVTHEIRVFGGASGAKAPPISAVCKSLTGLYRSISQRQHKQTALINEQNNLRQELYAPIYNLLKSDPRARDLENAIKTSHDKMRNSFSVALRKPMPNKPIFADAFVPDANEPSQFLVVSPYDFTAAYQHNGSGASSDQDGRLDIGAIPQWEDSAWAWAGVGFPLVPDQDRTYQSNQFSRVITGSVLGVILVFLRTLIYR